MPRIPDAQVLDTTESTEWWDISDTVRDVSLFVYGTFVGTYVIDISADRTAGTSKEYVTLSGSYTTARVIAIPAGAAQFVRVRCTVYTSGIIKATFTHGLSDDGKIYPIVTESRVYGQ